MQASAFSMPFKNENPEKKLPFLAKPSQEKNDVESLHREDFVRKFLQKGPRWLLLLAERGLSCQNLETALQTQKLHSPKSQGHSIQWKKASRDESHISTLCVWIQFEEGSDNSKASHGCPSCLLRFRSSLVYVGNGTTSSVVAALAAPPTETAALGLQSYQTNNLDDYISRNEPKKC